MLPRFNLTIEPASVESADLKITGSVETEEPSLSFTLMPWHSYEFSRAGKSITVRDKTKIQFTDEGAHSVEFEGTSHMSGEKYAASEGEIYCLNNSVPNPEVLSNGSYYNVRFVLPHGYSALVSDADVLQLNGLEFQIAQFAKPVVCQQQDVRLEFVFPRGYSARKEYLDFIKNQLAADIERIGKLPYSTIKIGVIRRGGQTEINGNPSGNLILYSRTALGDPVSLKSPAAVGITDDISVPLRKLVIAHELSHLWFGSEYLGKDGWMQEGIPQYLGWVAATNEESASTRGAMLTFFEKMSMKGSRGPIPNHPFNETDSGIIQSYYQGPLALYKVGEQIGQDKLLAFLLSVYREHRDPTFDDFNRKFADDFPAHHSLWWHLWQLDQSQS
jgi:hypothetical protein